jgi:hypothetical protein
MESSGVLFWLFQTPAELLLAPVHTPDAPLALELEYHLKGPGGPFAQMLPMASVCFCCSSVDHEALVVVPTIDTETAPLTPSIVWRFTSAQSCDSLLSGLVENSLWMSRHPRVTTVAVLSNENRIVQCALNPASSIAASSHPTWGFNGRIAHL